MKDQEKFLAQVENYIAQGIFPGANFAVIEQGKVTEFVRGEASIFPERTQLTTGKVWDLASVTKVVGTGTVIINLVLEGSLDLDAPLKKYYPAFTDETVSLRQLLTHTSGIDPFITRRDELTADELKSAIQRIKVTENKDFHYTDINFILLGFMLEEYYGKSLDQIFFQQVFKKWGMSHTQFGPVKNAVPTSLTVPVGTVHDPKAQVLGVDCGSAGLFSTLGDLVLFVTAYFEEEKYLQLLSNFAVGEKKRSLAWDLPARNDDWLLHTGYTGTFILLNPKIKKGVVFLSNRVHLKDEREKWIQKRDVLIQMFIENLEDV